MDLKKFILFRFVYFPSGQSSYETVYIVAQDFEFAFRILYITYGEDIIVMSCERLAMEGIDLLIDEMDYIESHKSYNSVVIDGVKKFEPPKEHISS